MKSITWIETSVRDVRYAWRTLFHSPGYTLMAVLTLGLGIGANRWYEYRQNRDA